MPDDKRKLRQCSSERRTLSQICDQVIHTTQIVSQQRLLLLSRPSYLTLAIGPLPTLSIIECACQFAGTALQHCRDRDGAVRRWDGRCFGHEIEVEEFDELELDLSACFAGLEDRRDGQEAVEVLECACILGRLDECACKGDDGCGLDGWAVDGFEEIEEML